MAILEFNDPLVNKTISYSISTNLADKWKALKKKVLKENSDRTYIVVGRERSGKSFWTFQQAKCIDPTFNLERICFTGEQFLDQIRHAPEGSVVVFDEAFRGFSTRAALSKMNRLLVQSMMEVGRRNLIIFVVLPVFSLLEYYIAISRSYALFVISHIKEKGYRSWRVYSEKKKSEIYYKSKKNYGTIPYMPTRNRGKFYAKTIMTNGKKTKTPYETFPLEEYEKKKDEAFKGKGEKGILDESKMTEQRRIFLVNWYLDLKRLQKIKVTEFLKRLEKIDCRIEPSNFNHLKAKVGEEGKILID